MTDHLHAVFFNDEAVFDDAAIKRILDKVAETPQGKNLVQRCPRDKLAEKLVFARGLWRIISAAHRGHVGRVNQKRAKEFHKLAKAAKHFKKYLCEEVVEETVAGDSLNSDLVHVEVITRRWLSLFPTPPDLKAFLVTVERVISVAEGFAQTYEYKVKGRSPKESFVGDILRPIFGECFGQPAGAPGDISGRGGQDIQHGLFTRFVIAVDEEMKVGLSVDVIKRALQPPRRKHKEAKRPRGR